MEPENSFLGKGWSFPPTFDPLNRQVEMISGEEDIRQSLQILLATRIGERVMQPQFGCNLDDLVFETLDTSLITDIKNKVETSILYFEPRINLLKVEVIPQSELEGRILLSIHYIIRATNSRSNLVFPFYLSEK
jgi:phage baseplate assembly protein W